MPAMSQCGTWSQYVGRLKSLGNEGLSHAKRDIWSPYNETTRPPSRDVHTYCRPVILNVRPAGHFRPAELFWLARQSNVLIVTYPTNFKLRRLDLPFQRYWPKRLQNIFSFNVDSGVFFFFPSSRQAAVSKQQQHQIPGWTVLTNASLFNVIKFPS